MNVDDIRLHLGPLLDVLRGDLGCLEARVTLVARVEGARLAAAARVVVRHGADEVNLVEYSSLLKLVLDHGAPAGGLRDRVAEGHCGRLES